MRELDLKKLKVELLRVNTAKAEFEFRIDEKMDEIEQAKLNFETKVRSINEDIERIKTQIDLQNKRIEELKEILK